MTNDPLWIRALMRIADWIPEWDVPLVGRIPITREGERTTVEDYYGTCLCCWYLMVVLNPALGWSARRWTRRQRAGKAQQ